MRLSSLFSPGFLLILFALPAQAQNIDADSHTKGQNSYVDVTHHHIRNVSATTIPQVPGITANCTRGQTTVTISSATTFQNGDGVNVFGCGTSQSMVAPTMLTVTPSIARVMTGTGDVVNSPTGSTKYNYKVMACDEGGGCTVPTLVTITNGLPKSSLGSQSVSLTSSTRSGQQVTVTTASPHGLPVLCSNLSCPMVYILGNSDPSFNGWQHVDSIVDTMHFTYTTGQSTLNGSTSSSTGGTAFWFNCNHLSWRQVTGAFRYVIYSDRAVSGTFARLGFSKPTNPFRGLIDGELYFDDFGSPTMDNNLASPPYIPATAPGAATSDNLVTTIVSGAGTASLRLANAIGTSVTGATIVYDSAPNIKAAVVAGTTTYIPNTIGTVLNSVLDLTATNVALVGGNGLTINDTLVLRSGAKWDGNIFPIISGAAQFQFQSEPQIQCNANPCIFATDTISHISHLQLNGQGNGQLLLLADGIGGDALGTYSNIHFGGASSGPDSMNMAMMMRGEGAHFYEVFWGGQQVASGTNATPAFYSDGGGQLDFDKVFQSGRGMLIRGGGSGGYVTLNWGYEQGGLTPFMTVTGGSMSNAGMYLDLKNIVLDTMAEPTLTYLPSGGTLTVGLQIWNGGLPALGVPQITGNPLISVQGSTAGQNVSAIAGANFTDNFMNVVGTGQFAFPISTPAAPLSAVISTGGSVPLGKHTYAISWIDVNGYNTASGPTISVNVTTRGTQTVTLTPPSLAAGAIGYKVFRDGNYTKGYTGGCSGGPFGGTTGFATVLGSGAYVDTSGSTCNDAQHSPQASAQGISRIGVNTSALLFTGGGFTNTLGGTFTANRTQTLQDATDTFVYRATTDTLTNKTLTSPALTTPTIGGGSAINKVLQGHALSLSSAFTSISAGTCQEQTLTLTGAATTGTAFVSPTATPGMNFSWSAWVGSSNTINVRLCAGSTATPRSVTWNATVIQ